MFIRAMLLLVGTFVAMTLPGAGGATGPNFSSLLLVILFYSLILSVPRAAMLAAVAMAGFAACFVADQPVSPWKEALVQGGLLVLATALFIATGRTMRQSDDTVEAALRDHKTLLYNESGFFIHGAVMLEECRRRQRPFSMVLLDASDLRDIPDLLGRKVTNDLFAQAVQAISKVPGEGIAARIDANEFGLLLPGVPAERAAALMQQRLGDPPQISITFEGKPVVIHLEMAIAQALEATQSIEELYDILHARRSDTGPPSTGFGAAIFWPQDRRSDRVGRDGSPTVPVFLAKR